MAFSYPPIMDLIQLLVSSGNITPENVNLMSKTYENIEISIFQTLIVFETILSQLSGGSHTSKGCRRCSRIDNNFSVVCYKNISSSDFTINLVYQNIPIELEDVQSVVERLFLICRELLSLSGSSDIKVPVISKTSEIVLNHCVFHVICILNLFLECSSIDFLRIRPYLIEMLISVPSRFREPILRSVSTSVLDFVLGERKHPVKLLCLIQKYRRYIKIFEKSKFFPSILVNIAPNLLDEDEGSAKFYAIAAILNCAVSVNEKIYESIHQMLTNYEKNSSNTDEMAIIEVCISLQRRFDRFPVKLIIKLSQKHQQSTRIFFLFEQCKILSIDQEKLIAQFMSICVSKLEKLIPRHVNFIRQRLKSGDHRMIQIHAAQYIKNRSYSGLLPLIINFVSLEFPIRNSGCPDKQPTVLGDSIKWKKTVEKCPDKGVSDDINSEIIPIIEMCVDQFYSNLRSEAISSNDLKTIQTIQSSRLYRRRINLFNIPEPTGICRFESFEASKLLVGSIDTGEIISPCEFDSLCECIGAMTLMRQIKFLKISLTSLDCKNHLSRRRSIEKSGVYNEIIHLMDSEEMVLMVSMCLVEPIYSIRLAPVHMSQILYHRILVKGYPTEAEYEILRSFECWASLEYDLKIIFSPILKSNLTPDDRNLVFSNPIFKIEEQILHAALMEARNIKFRCESEGICDYLVKGGGDQGKSPVVEYAIKVLGGKRSQILHLIRKKYRLKLISDLIFSFSKVKSSGFEDAVGVCSDPMALDLCRFHPKFFAHSVALISANMVKMCVENRLSPILFRLFESFL